MTTPIDLAEPRAHTGARPALAPGLALAVVRFALGLGIVADALFRQGPDGLAFPIWMALVAAAVVALVLRTRTRVSVETIVWLAVAVAFASGLAWRASDAVLFLDLCAALLALCLAAITIHDPRATIANSGIADLVDGIARSVLGGMFGAIRLLTVDHTAAHAARWKRRARPGMRAAAIVLAILLVFGSLLRSADPVFASLIPLPSFDVGTLLSHVLVIAAFTWILAGAMRRTLLGAQDSPLVPPAPPALQLGALEITATLLTLDALFAAFVLAQLGWLFGGEEFLRARTGLTAAEYARRGFFQTMWVVALVVPLLVGTRAALRPGRSLAARHTMLSIPVIAFVGAIIASAALRMRLYIHYFGLSTDRVYTMVIMAWLGVVLAWLAVTMLRGRDRQFVGGVVVSGFMAVACVNVWPVDVLVARVNVERAAAMRSPVPIDVRYLASLGGEAVPIATQAILQGATAAELDRCKAARTLLARFGPESERRERRDEHGWLHWNASERAAFRVIDANESALAAIASGDCAKPAPPAQR